MQCDSYPVLILAPPAYSMVVDEANTWAMDLQEQGKESEIMSLVEPQFQQTMAAVIKGRD